jgi:membrane-bound acyltransferase YfiQ involved in biofilm formation
LAYGLLYQKHFVYIAPIFVTYCTVFVGMIEIPEMKFLRDCDYSYGIYLYGYPIIQAWLALFPALRGHVYIVGMLSLFSVVTFAAFSWRFIEKPTLLLKRHLPSRQRV